MTALGGPPPEDSAGIAAALRPGARDVLHGEADDPAPAAGLLGMFLRERDGARALALWLGAMRPRDGRHLARIVESDVARIDELACTQLDAVLHHPRMQALEASWRGLFWLVGQVDRYRDGDSPPIKIRVLGLAWAEAARDLERAIEFDQSQLFKKIHDAEFGTAGGEPFGLVVGDFEVSHRPRPGHGVGDVPTLEAFSRIAAAAFAPFVAGCHPSLLGLDAFKDLELPVDLARTFDLPEYTRWTAFRRTEDARFAALVLPRVLARLPWGDDGSRADGFRYREDASAPDGSGLLWGTAVYAFASVVARAFGETSWPAEIRGLPDEGGFGGVVEGLPLPDFETDLAGVAPKIPTDVRTTDHLEQELGDLGFVSLCPLAGTRLAAFYGTPSVQLPRKYDEHAATVNARLSSMVQYMLCVSRFTHYVKSMGRDKVGSYSTAEQCRDQLQAWLMTYTIGDDDASPAMKARYPLRDAQVEVRSHPGKPGAYFCVVHLKPHYQLDQVAATMRLVTEFTPIHAG